MLRAPGAGAPILGRVSPGRRGGEETPKPIGWWCHGAEFAKRPRPLPGLSGWGACVALPHTPGPPLRGNLRLPKHVSGSCFYNSSFPFPGGVTENPTPEADGLFKSFNTACCTWYLGEDLGPAPESCGPSQDSPLILTALARAGEMAEIKGTKVLGWW